MEISSQATDDNRLDTMQKVKDQYAPCLVLIRSAYPTLTEAEGRVADYILAHPGYVLATSVAEVARQSNVGVATVNRLSNKLGYRSYTDLKIALAVELLSPNHQVQEPISVNDDVPVVVDKVMRIAVQNLHDSSSLLDTAVLAEAAHHIQKARRVEAYATGGLSGPIAQIAQYRFLMLGVPCVALTDSQQQVVSAGLLTEHDVALGLSNSGASQSVAAALEMARASGAQTVCITGTKDSLVARFADYCLLVANQETFVASDQVTSRIAMLSVLDALYAVIALQKFRSID